VRYAPVVLGAKCSEKIRVLWHRTEVGPPFLFVVLGEERAAAGQRSVRLAHKQEITENTGKFIH